MRLVCPSCSAEYEVDESAIGLRGRMVRCASCSAEWFQAPAVGAAAPLAPEPAPAAQPTPAAASSPVPSPAARAEPVVESRIETAEDAGTGNEATADLREAFRDMREAEPKPFRVDPQPPQQDRESVSEKIYFDEDPPVVETAATATIVEETRVRSRKRTEPEDLAASLREADARTSGGGGAFLAGFATVTLIALIMIAVYVKAPDIVALAPAVDGPLTAYASAVDQGRVALASLIGG